MDSDTLKRWTRVAEKGGLPEGTALLDVSAEGSDQLMFFKGDTISVLTCEDDSNGIYLGYCEGVLGKFDKSHVSFGPTVILPRPASPPSSTSARPRSAANGLSIPITPPTPPAISPTSSPLVDQQQQLSTSSSPRSLHNGTEAEDGRSSSPLTAPTSPDEPPATTSSSPSPPTPSELPEPTPRRRPVSTAIGAGSDELEKKRRRRGDHGVLMDFGGFLAPLAPEPVGPISEDDGSEVSEKDARSGKGSDDAGSEADDEPTGSQSRRGSELEIRIPAQDSTFEFDDGPLSHTTSTTASPAMTSGSSADQDGSGTPSSILDRRDSSAIGHATAIRDAALQFPLPPTHEATPSPESATTKLPSSPPNHAPVSDFASASSSPSHQLAYNSHARKASLPQALTTSSAEDISPRRASTNSSMLGSPNPSPAKHAKSPSSRSLAGKLSASFSSSTLATSSRGHDDGEEEWDIFADYARASMYEPAFTFESGSDSGKKGNRLSKRISKLPPSFAPTTQEPLPPAPIASLPTSPPRPSRSPRRPSSVLQSPPTPTARLPLRSSISMPISPPTPIHSLPDSPATLVGASILGLTSPTSPSTPPSPTSRLLPDVAGLEELRAISPSGGVASGLREMIKGRNEALGRRSEDDDAADEVVISGERPASTAEDTTSNEPADESFASTYSKVDSPPLLPSEPAEPVQSIEAAKEEMKSFQFPAPAGSRPRKPSLGLTINTDLAAPSRPSIPTEPVPQLPLQQPISPSEDPATAFHGRTNVDLASSPGPVPISFFVGSQANNQQHSSRPHPFSSVSPPLSPVDGASMSMGLGLGLPGSPGPGPLSADSATLGWREDGMRSPLAGEAGTGSFSRGSLSSMKGGATPRPGFFPKERPRSRSFSAFTGQTVELGFPVITHGGPGAPGSPNSVQHSFASLSSQPSFGSNTAGGFRDHRPSLQSTLAIGGGRYPGPVSSPWPDGSGSSSPRRNSERPPGSSPSQSAYPPRSPLVPSQLSSQPPFSPPPPREGTNSPRSRFAVEFPSSRSASSPMASTSSTPAPLVAPRVEATTPKRGFFGMFRARSSSMASSRASIQAVAALAPPPVPSFPSGPRSSLPGPAAAPVPSALAPSPAIFSPPPPPPQQHQHQQQQENDRPGPAPTFTNPFKTATSSPLSPKAALPFSDRRPSSPEIRTSKLASAPTPETVSAPFPSSSSQRTTPPRRLSTSTTTSLSRVSSAGAKSLELNPPTMSQARSSSSLASVSSLSLRSPKSTTKLRKQSALSPSKRTVPLPQGISSKDFQEETVQEGGLEFELLKPLARKASLEHRRSIDQSSANHVEEQLRRPTVPVPQRSASGPAVRPSTPKFALETDEHGFYLRPGKKSMKAPDGPSNEQFRDLEQKWLSIISTPSVASMKRDKKTKKLIRAGLPPSLRGRIWAFLLNCQVQRRQGLFDQLCVVAPATPEMEEAASKAFADHEQFNDPNSGRHDLLAILRSYAQLNSALGFQPGMASLGGTLLIHSPAEDSFWLFASVVDSIRNVYKKDLAVEALVFVYMLEALDKPLAKRLIVDCKVDPELLLARWVTPMFVRVLPWATVLRIWDVTFFEGPSYLLRIALSILLSSRSRLMDTTAMKTREHIKLYLAAPPHDHLVSADALIPYADGLKVSTKEDDLRKLRSRAMVAIDEGRQAARAAAKKANPSPSPSRLPNPPRPTTPGRAPSPLGGGMQARQQAAAR